ncbi:MAG: ABC transporter substrate-binding protein [Acidobacteriia bacterium]|nr:ABC transporter substrate-binding protein [Terriglobia bacterium]
MGEQDRIVGISGFTARPPEARRTKPKVSAFTSAKFDQILALEPDLVIGFSDLQAEIARELIARGVNVLVFNQRSVEEILDTILAVARLVGAQERGLALVVELRYGLDAIRRSASSLPRRPAVFFEEWNEPLISGIRWVDELVEIAGGSPIFPELRACPHAKGRIVGPSAVLERNPEVVIASWCGRKVNKDAIRARPGWRQIRHVYEIKSTYILQPGPAALTDGVRQLHSIIAEVAETN